MRKRLFILLVILLAASYVWAAIDTSDKRKSAQLISFVADPPEADGTIAVQDRAALAGVYWVYSTAAATTATDTTGWNRRRDRYDAEGYRSRYNN